MYIKDTIYSFEEFEEEENRSCDKSVLFCDTDYAWYPILPKPCLGQHTAGKEKNEQNLYILRPEVTLEDYFVRIRCDSFFFHSKGWIFAVYYQPNNLINLNYLTKHLNLSQKGSKFKLLSFFFLGFA